MTVRNIHTREGYDIWDKLCAIPCYGFLLAPEGSRVVKAEGIGNWIDKHAAQEVVDQAQSELNELRAALAAVTAERERLARDLAFTEQWYAVRFERLAELGKTSGCWDAMAAIIANGTADSHEPPTYAQQLVRANHRASVAERERDQLRAEVEALRGLMPEPPLRAPDGEGMPRYGLRWNGPQQPLSVPMADGYWTPWHMANGEVEALRKDAERYSLLAGMVVADCAGAEMAPQQAALFGSLNAITHIRTTAELDAVFDAAMAAKDVQP